MATYVTRIRTQEGDKQIDYESLANLPTSDTTLTQSGKFADAKATGDRIDRMSSDIAKTIKPEDIGALPDTYTPPVTSVNGQTGAVNITVPDVPVTSVNSKIGAVQLTASDVHARPDTWMPNASDVGAATSDHTHNYLSGANFSFDSSSGRLTITI